MSVECRLLKVLFNTRLKMTEKPTPFIQNTFDSPLQVMACVDAINQDGNHSLQVQCGLIVVACRDGSPPTPISWTQPSVPLGFCDWKSSRGKDPRCSGTTLGGRMLSGSCQHSPRVWEGAPLSCELRRGATGSESCISTS